MKHTFYSEVHTPICTKSQEAPICQTGAFPLMFWKYLFQLQALTISSYGSKNKQSINCLFASGDSCLMLLFTCQFLQHLLASVDYGAQCNQVSMITQAFLFLLINSLNLGQVQIFSLPEAWVMLFYSSTSLQRSQDCPTVYVIFLNTSKICFLLLSSDCV